jgi:membrane fusion protein, copper/silver efflux system
MKKVQLASLCLVGATAVCFLASSLFRDTAATKALNTPVRTILYYRDPMHPSYTSDRPGKAPDCGMDLQPVYADESDSTQTAKPQGASGVIQVSRERQQMIGVRLGRVERSSTKQILRTLGRVVPSENSVFPVTAGGDGWVTQIFPDATTGKTVREGQPLAIIYGQEYDTAQRSFLYALLASENPPPPARRGDTQDQLALTLQEAKLALRSLGFGETQIQQLAKSRQVIPDVTLTAPAAGIIVARNAFLKQKFERGAELFRIADLSHVWIDADMFGGDEAYIRGGSSAEVSLPDRPTATLRATVSEALPRFDAESRTLKLRLEVANPNLILRPDMFVDLAFSISLPEATTVPADAVVESGLRKTVFVDRGEGMFEPRTVETGWHFGGRVQIVHGLNPGESIVVSGNFLLDSESHMRSGDAGGHD